MKDRFTYDELMNVGQAQVEIDSKQIDILEYTINALNIFSVAGGTTGYCGGDSGHGGRTYLKFEDHGSTDMKVRCNDQDTFTEASSIEICFGGDSELHALIQGLKFLTKVLESQVES